MPASDFEAGLAAAAMPSAAAALCSSLGTIALQSQGCAQRGPGRGGRTATPARASDRETGLRCGSSFRDGPPAVDLGLRMQL